jgi:beta-lactamase superfamily II metal-dependent hydrolase
MTRKPTTSRKRADHSMPGVTARLYCQGIGDCHLLKFRKDDGGDFWMMIDCGVHTSIKGGNDTVRKIVADVLTQTKRLDVIVLTHEHWDHNSGFLRAKELFAQFEYVGEVWMAWTENAADKQTEGLDKFKKSAGEALALAADALSARDANSDLAQGVRAMFGFLGDVEEVGAFAAKGALTRDARDALVKIGKGKVRYLEPEDQPFSPTGLSGVRIYVLGPPRNKTLLRKELVASEVYGFGVFEGLRAADALVSALKAGGSVSQIDESAPFDSNEGYAFDEMRDPGTSDRTANAAKLLDDQYGPLDNTAGGKDPWRRIDHDWMAMSADLAMQLDRGVNNTSLVLAFEFVATGRVLLFPGDAQVGNWLSWQDARWTVDGKPAAGADLLARTVFYKVAHHGSENATLKQKGL